MMLSNQDLIRTIREMRLFRALYVTPGSKTDKVFDTCTSDRIKSVNKMTQSTGESFVP